MKVAIPSSGEGLSAEVERQFGRCDTFLIVDTKTLESRAVPNKAKDQAGGAGIAAAQQIIDEGAEAVLAGVVGPNAAEVLKEAHVSVYEDVSGTVVDVLEMLESGDLERSPEAPAFGQGIPATGSIPAGRDSGPGDPIHVVGRRDEGWGRGQGRGRGGRGRGGGRARRNRRARARRRDFHL